jgi:hypothetical protein
MPSAVTSAVSTNLCAVLSSRNTGRGVLVLKAVQTAPSSCVLATSAPGSTSTPRTFVDTALVPYRFIPTPSTVSVMDVLLAVIGAAIATALGVELFLGWRKRKRLHAELWAIAFGAYAVATWALAFGLAFGWTSVSFRTFYYLGAIANISLLAVGSVALWRERVAKRLLPVVNLWLVLGFFATFLAPFVAPLPAEAVPEGSEVFDFTFMIEALTLPGPRLFAAISGAIGSIVIIGFALVSAIGSWRSNRRLAYGNILIIGGVLVPAFGGSLTALGESSALAISLAVGITLLWFGYHMASSARPGKVPPEGRT